MIKRRMWVAAMVVTAVLLVLLLMVNKGRFESESWLRIVVSGLLATLTVGCLLVVDESLKPTWGVYCFCFLVSLAIPLFFKGKRFELFHSLASVFPPMLLAFGLAGEFVRRCYLASPNLGNLITTILSVMGFGLYALFPLSQMRLLPASWSFLTHFSGPALLIYAGALSGRQKARGKNSDKSEAGEKA